MQYLEIQRSHVTSDSYFQPRDKPLESTNSVRTLFRAIDIAELYKSSVKVGTPTILKSRAFEIKSSL